MVIRRWCHPFKELAIALYCLILPLHWQALPVRGLCPDLRKAGTSHRGKKKKEKKGKKKKREAFLPNSYALN